MIILSTMTPHEVARAYVRACREDKEGDEDTRETCEAYFDLMFAGDANAFNAFLDEAMT